MTFTAPPSTTSVGRSHRSSTSSTLPKTKNGKIMRRVIKARHLSLPLGDLVALDPATPVEDIPTHVDKESSDGASQP